MTHSIDFDAWARQECNRYANGHCHTRSCLVRGGYLTMAEPDYDVAVCGVHAALSAMKEKDAEIASLRLRLEKAEAALRPFAEAAEDLEDRDWGPIWERPEAMQIECDDLRKARDYFAGVAQDNQGTKT